MPVLRILLVEDEVALLALLKRHLERSGHTVVVALSAELALDALESDDWRPNLLIADETLPGMNGAALAAFLLARFPELMSLLSSGFPLSLEALPAAVRSRAAILQKPFMPAMLDRAIAALVASNPGSGA